MASNMTENEKIHALLEMYNQRLASLTTIIESNSGMLITSSQDYDRYNKTTDKEQGLKLLLEAIYHNTFISAASASALLISDRLKVEIDMKVLKMRLN